MAPFRIARPRFLAFFALELGLIVTVIAGLGVLTHILTSGPTSGLPTVPVLLISAMFCAVLISMQWVNVGDDDSPRRELIFLSVTSTALGFLGYAAVSLMLGAEQRMLPGLLILEGAVAVPVTVALWRWFFKRMRFFGGMREKVLIVGTGETAREVCRWIVNNHAREYGVIGFVDENSGRLGTVLAMGVRIQTDYESLARFCPSHADRVIVALDEKRGKLPVHQLMELRLLGVDIEEATSFFERTSGKIAVETMLPSWLIFSEGFKTTRLRMIIKRAADIVLSALLLVLTAPLMVLTTILIKLDSRGLVIYRQDRLGREGQSFRLLKFRSMRQGAENESGPTWASDFDPRVTRIGRVIRKLRVDELPQLINVLRGEMSFVGPRPERAHFVKQLEKRIPYYGLRMVVRPGVTGWAQVQYGYAGSDEDAKEKLKYDLFYIKNANPILDLWIVLKTIGVVLGGSGAR